MHVLGRGSPGRWRQRQEAVGLRRDEGPWGFCSRVSTYISIDIYRYLLLNRKEALLAIGTQRQAERFLQIPHRPSMTKPFSNSVATRDTATKVPSFPKTESPENLV